MVEYIYIVKCPDCEDEHFDFFDDAKGFALGCLSQKPIITQTEVERNDFGECTDHCDLGTVWSWEDVMNDENMLESEASVFSKADLQEYDPDNDPEFQDDDFFAVNDFDESCRKSIPEGMSLKDLVEEMEEHEDHVECAGCEELFPKEDCFHKEGIGWLCGDCEDRIVKCTWCDELFDRGECRYEVDLGWLCDRCEAAIKSRGETLTFREGNYWDFLDEARDPFDHHDPDYSDDSANDALAYAIDRAKDKRYDDALDALDGPLPEYRYSRDPETGAYHGVLVNRSAFSEEELKALGEAAAIPDSTSIGKHIRLVYKDSDYHPDGMEYLLYDVKRLLKDSAIADLSTTSINLIVKFDNNCKVIQETEKGYLVQIPCYFRNQKDRSKIEEKPVYVRCWVPKAHTEFINV